MSRRPSFGFTRSRQKRPKTPICLASVKSASLACHRGKRAIGDRHRGTLSMPPGRCPDGTRGSSVSVRRDCGSDKKCMECTIFWYRDLRAFIFGYLYLRRRPCGIGPVAVSHSRMVHSMQNLSDPRLRRTVPRKRSLPGQATIHPWPWGATLRGEREKTKQGEPLYQRDCPRWLWMNATKHANGTAYLPPLRYAVPLACLGWRKEPSTSKSEGTCTFRRHCANAERHEGVVAKLSVPLGTVPTSQRRK